MHQSNFASQQSPMLLRRHVVASQQGCACEFVEDRRMIRKVRLLSGVAALIGLAVLAPVRAQAGLTLTAAGVADGFALTTYATGVGGSNYSFLAAAPLLNPNVGTLAVIDNAHGLLR